MVEMVHSWRMADPAKTFRPVPSDAPDNRTLVDLCAKFGGWIPSASDQWFGFHDMESAEYFKEAVEGVWDGFSVAVAHGREGWMAYKPVPEPPIPSLENAPERA